jgi:hypothetical protein
MISIGIDVHKKKCTATLKRDSKRIVEQTSFCNNSYGINEFIQQTLPQLNTACEQDVDIETIKKCGVWIFMISDHVPHHFDFGLCER